VESSPLLSPSERSGERESLISSNGMRARREGDNNAPEQDLQGLTASTAEESGNGAEGFVQGRKEGERERGKRH